MAAGRTGLPWPDLNDAGAVSLLQTLRTAAGPPGSVPSIGVVLPVPGDVRGLPAGTQFQRDAVTAGEAGADVADPRGLVEEVLESGRQHRIPDHAPTRAMRVLENAAHVDAIITVSSGLIPSGLQSSSEVQIASDALRPLSGVVRSARMAAVGAILFSAWQG